MDIRSPPPIETTLGKFGGALFTWWRRFEQNLFGAVTQNHLEQNI